MRENLEQVLHNSLRHLCVELARRLFAGGHQELAEVALMASELESPGRSAQASGGPTVTPLPSTPSEGAPVSSSATLGILNPKELGWTLFDLYQSTLALEHCAGRVADAEARLLAHLSAQARREINALRALPPAATTAAQRLEFLLAVSPFKGAGATLFADALTSLRRTNAESAQTLLSKPTLQRRDLPRKPDDASRAWMLLVAQSLLTCLANLLRTLKAISDSVERASSDQGRLRTLSSFSAYGQIIESHAASLSARRFQNLGSDLQSAHEDLFVGAFIPCAHRVESLSDAMIDMADVLARIDRTPVATAQPAISESEPGTDRYAIENYFYIRSLERQLHALGETREEVARMAEAIFAYAAHHKVQAASLLDDEYVRTNPRVNRENVVRARLEARLHDLDYPLSVAHKDWITRTADRLSDRLSAPQENKVGCASGVSGDSPSSSGAAS